LSRKDLNMQEPRLWREFLGTLLADPREKERVAKAMGIHPITLSRWVSGDANPGREYIQALLNALPEQREEIFKLIMQEEIESVEAGFGPDEWPGSGRRHISAVFYEQVLNSSITVSADLRFFSLASMIVQQALSHLDLRRQGMAISIIQCMPPIRNAGVERVRSLRAVLGVGTPPWDGDAGLDACLFGIESLAGMAVEFRKPMVMTGSDAVLLGACKNIEYERSAAACPIMRIDHIAGCLLASSALEDYFGEEELTLLQHYADLLTLAFEPQQFYAPALLGLGVLPPPWRQYRYLASFKDRALEEAMRSGPGSPPLSAAQVDVLAWQFLEEALLRIARE
jgi:transcriptional regulator with XRE-family HTH domain